MTLTLEPRLPEGCKADDFPGGIQSSVGKALPPHQLLTLALEIPRASEGRALDLFIHVLTSLFLLPHSLVDCSGTPACTTTTETALAKVT